MAQKTEKISAGDGVELSVADLPENLQKLVIIYDETQDRLAKAKTDSLIYSAASQWFLSSITNSVEAHLKSQQPSETVEHAPETVTEESATSEE